MLRLIEILGVLFDSERGDDGEEERDLKGRRGEKWVEKEIGAKKRKKGFFAGSFNHHRISRKGKKTYLHS